MPPPEHLDVIIVGAGISGIDAAYHLQTSCPGKTFAILDGGHTDASWTQKCGLTSRYVCRLLNHMDEHHHRWGVPRRDPAVAEQPPLDFSSGSVQRSNASFPVQGDKPPWKLYQNYALDDLMMGRGKIAGREMAFG